MDIILPVVLFVVGFVAGGFIIWQLKHKEFEAAKRSAKHFLKTKDNFLN